MTHERMTLAAHVGIFRSVRETIAAEFGLEADDEAVIDSAEGETDLAELLVKLLRAARVAAAQAKGIGELQKQMAERKSRLDAKADRLRAIVLNAMADAGLPKLAAPDFSAARARAPAPLVITADVAQIPDAMCRVVREADKAAIKAAIKAGEVFDWAHLGNPAETLVVRAI